MAVELWLDSKSDSHPFDGLRTSLRVAGRSMRPFLREGWTVTIAHTRRGIRCGDVIAYRAEGRVVVHRVVRRLSDGRLLTKGDCRLRFDPPVTPTQLIGHVTEIVTPWGSVDLTAPWWRAIQALLAWASCTTGRVATVCTIRSTGDG